MQGKWKKYGRLLILVAITIIWVVVAIYFVEDMVNHEEKQSSNAREIESAEPLNSPIPSVDESSKEGKATYSLPQEKSNFVYTPKPSAWPTVEPTANIADKNVEATFTIAPTVVPTQQPAKPTPEPTPAPTVDTAKPTQDVVTQEPEDPNIETDINDSSSDIAQYAWIEQYQPLTDKLVTKLGNLIWREVGAYISTLSYDKAIRAYKLLGSAAIHRLELEISGHKTLDEVISCTSCFGTVNSSSRLGVEECYSVAQDLLTNGPIGPKNLIFAAAFEQGETYEIFDDGRYVTYFGCNPNYPSE